MPKKVKGLTAAKVKSITKSGDYADGNGLYLKSNKYWNEDMVISFQFKRPKTPYGDWGPSILLVLQRPEK